MLRSCCGRALGKATALQSSPSTLFSLSRSVWYSGCAGMERGQEKLDGFNISYVRTGSGPNAVLCLPGALGSALTDFRPQLEHLDKKNFTIIAWDPPGYGQSRPPDRDFTGDFFHRDADVALKLMKALKLPKFSMLGWSDGGITAMILAAKNPLNVHKCVVWGANAYVLKEELEIYKKIRDISTWSEKMRAPLIELYGEEYFRTTWEKWVDAFIHIYEVNDGDICKKEVKLIQCPLFVIHGDKDPLVSNEHPKHILDAVPHSRVFHFVDGKHNVHLRYAEKFNELVSEFLLECAPGQQLLKAIGGKIQVVISSNTSIMVLLVDKKKFYWCPVKSNGNCHQLLPVSTKM